jgi:hypothetical protein
LAGGAGAPVAGAAGRTSCPTSGKTVIQTPASRVYRAHGQTFGCIKRDGRAVALDHPAGTEVQSEVLQVFAVANRWAIGIVRITDTTTGQGPAGLAILDLHRQGRDFVAYYGDELGAGPDEFTAAVIRPNRATVWIQTTLPRPPDGAPPTEVLKRESHATKPTTLDAGDSIDPASLRRNGATISWTTGGLTRTAPLP